MAPNRVTVKYRSFKNKRLKRFSCFLKFDGFFDIRENHHEAYFKYLTVLFVNLYLNKAGKDQKVKDRFLSSERLKMETIVPCVTGPMGDGLLKPFFREPHVLWNIPQKSRS